ncbi:MAG TPA: hypothetical protein VNZ68_03950 [Rhodocyclaceae bacterium]|nr:hypothetical protein [Rhodocyclaceae bacterium]
MRVPLILLPLLLAACVSHPATPAAPEAPDNFRAEDFQPPATGARITLLPMQETQYDMLRTGAEMLESQLKRQLTVQGYQVTLVKRDDYLKHWQEEAKSVGGVYVEDSGEFKPREYTQALESLMRKTCAATSCALLINHRLLLRPAHIDKGKIAWDGVSQPFLLPSETEQGYAISVELTAVTPAGELGFRRYGAVTALSSLGLAEIRQQVEQKKLFVDAEVAQGVRIALQSLRERQGTPAATAPMPADTPAAVTPAPPAAGPEQPLPPAVPEPKASVTPAPR